MIALVTGASSGIGRDIARELAARGYDLILAARRVGRLEELAAELDVNVMCLETDLNDESQCCGLFDKVKEFNIDVLVNNAGFGLYGDFAGSDLKRELEMVNVNIRAVHILTKLFLRDFKARGGGRILNVASAAGFMPGPYMATYYASKNYVLRLSEAVNRELKSEKSPVSVSVLCPGPVHTEFGKVAGVHFGLVKGMSSEDVAKIAVDGMMRRKPIIVPGLMMKAAVFLRRLTHEGALLAVCERLNSGKVK